MLSTCSIVYRLSIMRQVVQWTFNCPSPVTPSAVVVISQASITGGCSQISKIGQKCSVSELYCRCTRMTVAWIRSHQSDIEQYGTSRSMQWVLRGGSRFFFCYTKKKKKKLHLDSNHNSDTNLLWYNNRSSFSQIFKIKSIWILSS